MQANHIEYCSRFITPSICTIEKGVEAIETILAKEVLCRHDVQKINRIYRKIEHLERQSSFIPKVNSHYVLEKIVDKIEKIASEKNLFGLVSLYHLQDFLDKGLFLEDQFSQMWLQVEKNPVILKQMAAYLSSCHSGQKRGKPQNYPVFFQELLENGYIHLYDHLICMKGLSNRMARLSEIQKIPFSLLSHIILETREAIFQKVKNAIPDRPSKILFLIGQTGNGKSTTLCFLRGDEMIEENFCYYSKSDNNGIIGDHIAASCTFLPTVETINDWWIVDFPGFEDTNGPLVSLGIEFALKALVKEYHPKILVLQSILNIEAGKELGLRLKRLLKNKEDCLLGITMYLKDSDSIAIKNLEAEQRKKEELELTTALQKASQEEDEILGSLEFAVEDGHSEETIMEMEKELSERRHKKEEIERALANFRKKRASLPDTPSKTKRKEAIENKEKVLQDLVGITNIFRFKNLSNQHISSFFLKLSIMKAIHPSFENDLDASDKRIINDCFENNLKKQMESQTDFQLNFQNFDFDSFKQIVLETSFISTIYSQSHPEIGKLFHLPEMDVNIVREYDRKIISACIKNIIDFVVQALDITFIEKVYEKIKKSLDFFFYYELQKKITRLQDYIIILYKGKHPLNKGDTDKEWAEFREKYQKEIDKIEQKTVGSEFGIFGLAALSIIIPWFYPVALLVLWLEKYDKKAELSGDIANTLSDNVDEVYDILLKLSELEKIILKQEQMNEMFKSVEIVTSSIESLYDTIMNRINKVRKIYGGSDWDRRVAFLEETFKMNSMQIFQSISVWCLSIYAYLIIEPDLFFEIEIYRPAKRRNEELTELKFYIDRERNLSNTINEYNHSFGLFDKIFNSFNLDIKQIGSRVEIIVKGENLSYFKISERFMDYFDEPLLVNRALYAAAFLKAYA